MVNKARSTFFDIPTNTFGTVGNVTIVGLISRAARENAPNPRYLFMTSDLGEILLYDKDGSLIYGPLAAPVGHANPSEVSISSDRLALIRTGTNLCLLNSDGTVRWNYQGGATIANLIGAKIGTLHVCCFINTAVVGTSGVQWRSLVDGSITQAVYGVGGAAIVANYGAIACGQTGERAAIVYSRISNTARYEHHHITLGRLWSFDQAHGSTDADVEKIAVDKDCGYTIFCLKKFAEGVASTVSGFIAVYDSVGALLGSSAPAASITYIGICMSPDGRQAGAYADATLANFNLYRIIVVPYTNVTTVLPARIKGLDITDDDLYYVVGCENGNIYVYRVDGLQLGTTPYGAATTPIAVVRNYI